MNLAGPLTIRTFAERIIHEAQHESVRLDWVQRLAQDIIDVLDASSTHYSENEVDTYRSVLDS